MGLGRRPPQGLSLQPRIQILLRLHPALRQRHRRNAPLPCAVSRPETRIIIFKVGRHFWLSAERWAEPQRRDRRNNSSIFLVNPSPPWFGWARLSSSAFTAGPSPP